MAPETRAASGRRVLERFFEKYCQGRGIDIGCGTGAVLPEVDKWDLALNPKQDATTMEGIEDGFYDFVYSSHCLEHLQNPLIALRNWWRILKPGGYLILLLPDRDLYEKRNYLPSEFNDDHKWYFLPTRSEEPVTLSLIELLNMICGKYDFIYLKRCEAISFECVIQKQGR